MTEKRYCIICGDEIHSNDPTADRCPKHGGPQPAQSPMPQHLEKAQQKGHDNSLPLPQKIEPWQQGQVILDTYEVKSKLGEGGSVRYTVCTIKAGTWTWRSKDLGLTNLNQRNKNRIL